MPSLYLYTREFPQIGSSLFYTFQITPYCLITWQTIFLKETENAAILPTFRWSTRIRAFVFQKIPIQKRHCSIVSAFSSTISQNIFFILSAHTIRMSASAIRILANSLIVSANSLIKWVRAGRDGISHRIFRWFLRYSWEPKTAKILYERYAAFGFKPTNGHE